MARLVLVTGATGVLGSHVVRELVTHGWRVRATTHRPDQARARALAGPRVEVVTADVRDPAALGRAVRGADVVFLLEPRRVDGADGARTTGVAVANAAAGAGVGHVVYCSLSGAGMTGQAGAATTTASTGATTSTGSTASTGVAHLDRKRAVELHLRALELPTTVLRPTLLMEQVLGFRGRTPMLTLLHQALRMPVPPEQRGAHYEVALAEQDSGGSTLLAPLVARVRSRHTHAPVQVVAAADVAAVARLAIETPERHVGLAVDLAGDELTAPEMAQAYREVTGRHPPGWFGPRRESPPDDLAALLGWVREQGFEADIPSLRVKYPWLATFPRWLLSLGAG